MKLVDICSSQTVHRVKNKKCHPNSPMQTDYEPAEAHNTAPVGLYALEFVA